MCLGLKRNKNPHQMVESTNQTKPKQMKNMGHTIETQDVLKGIEHLCVPSEEVTIGIEISSNRSNKQQQPVSHAVPQFNRFQYPPFVTLLAQGIYSSSEKY